MKFLAAVDLSDASLLALDALRALAGEQPGEVTLLHVVDLNLYTAGGSVPGIMEFARERLTEEAARLAGCGLSAPSIRVEQGDSTQTILRVAAEEQVDLIVMTNLGKGARTGRLFGSTAERVATSGAVPVLIERVGVAEGNGENCCRLVEGSPFERTLAAVDLADDPGAMLSRIWTLPGVGTARIVHVAEDDAAAADARARLGALAAGAPERISVESDVLVGDAATAILEDATAWEATAIALRPCSHGALHRAVWGSVARAVALNANCSILFTAAGD